MPIIMLDAVDVDESYVLVDPSGISHVLSDLTGVVVMIEQKGRWNSPVQLTEDDVPVLAGSRVRAVRDRSRTLNVPLGIFGATRAEKIGKLRLLQRWFRTVKGSPLLFQCSLDGTWREVEAYYAGGLEGDEATSQWGDKHALVTVDLRVPSSYWRDTTDRVVTFTLGSVAHPVFFKSPWYPVRFGSSTILGDTTIENDGDVEAWPVFTVMGPGGSVVLRNMTTGEVTTIAQSLIAGQRIVVDTRPGYKTATDGYGTDLYATLGGSQLWSLVPGLNRVQIEVALATSATSVTLAYRRQWLSA